MIVTRPPMGWNSWNTFGGNINENVIRETAKAMVDKGLRDAGYEYVVIDDCWSVHIGREPDGRLIPDPEKFPSGMKALADYIHSLGLKFGIYSCDGSHTCGGYPASFDHEFVHAEQFAEWGVDYLKYDNCWKPSMIPGKVLYNRMAMALRATGRDILFSACNWGNENSSEWMSSVGAHMYRSTYDIADSFESVKELCVGQIEKYNKVGYNCFNDLDMLICGMNGKGNVGISGCTMDEYTMHFALWCFLGSPLMIGCDVRNIDDETLALLKNPELLRIDQDAETRPPFVVHKNSGNCYTLFRHLENGEYAVGFFNFNDEGQTHARFESFEIGMTFASPYVLEFTNVMTGERKIVTEYDNYFMKPHTFELFRARLVRK